MLWANLHLLFWLSLIPFATAWMGENNFATAPTALYGIALLMPALAWQGLQFAILRNHGRDSAFAQALGRDLKGKMSPALYLTGVLLAFADPAAMAAIAWEHFEQGHTASLDLDVTPGLVREPTARRCMPTQR